MGFFDRFRKKQGETPREAETPARILHEEIPLEEFPDSPVTGESPEPFELAGLSDLSESLSFTITKGSVYEGMTMTAASLEDAAEHRQAAITNERIVKGDVILDTYEVESEAISGGMGSVWRVRHAGWGAELAMKRPQPRFFAEAGEARKANFVAECEHWINLGLHPNIVSCYYVREVGGVPTIFSEWMDFGSLKDAIATGSLYEGDDAEVQERILDIAIQAARGLAYSHERGLLHQDVKPANILLTSGWDAKVADFGLAKAASKLEGADMPDALRPTGYTPAYCPAEQAQGVEPARWMDVYAWALTVLEMYAGERTWQTGAEVKGNLHECCAQCRVPVPTGLQDLMECCLSGSVDGFGQIEGELVGIYRATVGSAYPRDASKAATDLADVLNNRALSMLDLGKVDEAEELWEQALEADPMHLASTYNQALHEWRRSYIDDVEAQRRVKVLAHPRADELADRLRHDVGRPADILENFDLRSTEQIISEQAEQAVNASKPTKAVYMMPCPNDERRVLAACDYWMEIVDAESGHSFVRFDMGVHPDNGILTSPVIDEEGRIVVRAHSGLWFEWNAYAANREALDAISAATEPVVYVWDMQTGACIRQLHGHEKRVRAVAIDKRGRTVYSAGEDKTLKVWNVDSGTCTGSFPLEEEVRSLAIDDNDEQLLIGTMLGNIIVWSIPDECDVGFLEGHDGEVDALAFGRDGVHALSNSKDSRRFWDVPDERCLMTSDGGGDTWMLCGRFPFGAVSREQVSTLPDDGRPAEWELSVVQSTAEALAFETAFNQALSEARASLEAKDIPAVLEHIATARSCHGFENDARLDELVGQIDSLCMKKGIRGITEIEEVPINCDGAQALHVTADGRHAIAVARYELVAWSMEHKRAIATLRSDEIFDWEDEWGSLYLSADGSRVLCPTYRAYPNKCLILDFTGDELRTKTGSICSPSSAEFEELSATKPLSVDPSLSTAAYNYKDKTFAVDLATGESKLLLDFSVDWVRISPDNAYMLYEAWRYDGSGDIKAFVANPFHTGAAERRFAENLGDLDVLAFDGDWKKALTATEDKHLAITSMETGEQIIALDFNGSYADHCPVFTSDERFVFISDYDGRLFIFEPETGECVYELDTQENIVTFVLGNDMHMLYVLNNKGNMRTWRVEYDYEWRGPEQALTPESSTKSEPTSEAE